MFYLIDLKIVYDINKTLIWLIFLLNLKNDYSIN